MKRAMRLEWTSA